LFWRSINSRDAFDNPRKWCCFHPKFLLVVPVHRFAGNTSEKLEAVAVDKDSFLCYYMQLDGTVRAIFQHGQVSEEE